MAEMGKFGVIGYGKGLNEQNRPEANRQIEEKYLPLAREIGFPLQTLRITSGRLGKEKYIAQNEDELRQFLLKGLLVDTNIPFAFEKAKSKDEQTPE